MILFLWVNNYKHIKKTGFNLSSMYEFSFITEKENPETDIITGNLICKKKETPKIFNDQIEDIKAIIGGNGAGKSTVLEILIQNLMTQPNFFFNGFIVSDKFIFNRKGINFGDSIAKIKHFNLKEITNTELVNYNRDKFQRTLKTHEVKDSYQGQVATKHLNHLSIIHYSPLLNIDRITNIEGVAGSSRTWETNYWHYYDYTTENCIVDDYHSLGIGETGYYISGESELLAHKSAESKRNLEFISHKVFKSLPFKNNIGNITIRLNDFYAKFWESIDSFFKTDNQLQGNIEEVITSFKEKSQKEKGSLTVLESNLYISFIYGSLKYEYKHRMNFGNRENSNPIISTIKLFLTATKKAKNSKTALEHFLKKTEFTKNLKSNIFQNIKKAIDFILASPDIEYRGNYDITLSFLKPKAINEFIKLFYDDFIIDDKAIEEKRSYIFHIFSIEFVGLSSGEKNLLSMFSRIQKAENNIPSTQSEIIFLFDEPEVTLHPQWQISFIQLLNDNLPKMFPKRKLQIIISSHSPILISDLPKTNILFLEKDDKTGECKVSNVDNMQNTFGANIHTLYAESFFLREKGGAMGKFAKGIIRKVIRELNSKNTKDPNYLKSIIDLVGEPLIQNQLFLLFYKKFPEQKIENLDERITYLEKQLKATREKKIKNSNEKD